MTKQGRLFSSWLELVEDNLSHITLFGWITRQPTTLIKTGMLQQGDVP